MLPQKNPRSAFEHPEYSVYIFPKDQKSPSMLKWKKAGVTRDPRRALKHARLLRHREQYHKIEVKKCFFCETQKRRVGKTIKIFYVKKPHLGGLFDAFLTKKAR